MSRSRGAPRQAPDPPAPTPPAGYDALPHGRMPSVGMREIVAVLHRRRERRRAATREMAAALDTLADAVERHLERVARLRAAVEARGDLAQMQNVDGLADRLRAELREAERALGDALGGAGPS